MKSGHKFEASLGYIVSFRLARVKFCLKTKQNKNHELGMVVHTFKVST